MDSSILSKTEIMIVLLVYIISFAISGLSTLGIGYWYMTRYGSLKPNKSHNLREKKKTYRYE